MAKDTRWSQADLVNGDGDGGSGVIVAMDRVGLNARHAGNTKHQKLLFSSVELGALFSLQEAPVH